MGASAQIYWPRMQPAQLAQMPGFTNDCKAWADWLVAVVRDSAALDALRELGCEAVTTFLTRGVDESEVAWVSPGELFAAAQTLSQLVADADAATGYLIELYGGTRYDVADPGHALSVDLADIAKMALHAAKLGVENVTMEVNW